MDYQLDLAIRIDSIIWLIVGPMFGINLLKHLFGNVIGEKTTHNQGVWLSLRNGVLLGLIIGVVTTKVQLDFELALWSRLILPRSWIFRPCLGRGIFWGLIGFEALGGIAFIRHFTLRYVLYRNHLAPWNLVSFLDYCVEKSLMQKTAGGYKFNHPLLKEHFATAMGH